MDRLIAKLGAALLAIAALSGILPGGASPVFAQSPTGWQASDDDKWLFEVRDGKFSLGEGVGGYQTDRGVCVDLADMIMALDLPVRLDKKSRRATGWVFQEGRTLTIDRDSGKVEIASKAETLAPGTIYDTPEGWCVETKALSRWLGAELKVDLANSSLSVVSERKLPFQLAAERRARAQSIRTSDSFDLSTLPQASRPYKIWQTPSVDVIASAAYGNGATASRVQARWDVLASGEVAGASFDARAFSDDKGKPAGLRLRAYRSDPAGGLLGPLRATYAAIGDVSSPATALSANSGAGRGAAITNRPLDQPESFDRTDFRGELPPGWDAELYHNGALLGFATPDPAGRYEFLDIPLYFGTNLFEVVVYGPQGQVRRETRSITVGPGAVPPGDTWYWAGVVEAGHDLIGRPPDSFRGFGWRAQAGLEHGIDQRTSVGVNLSSIVLDAIRRNYLEAALRRAFGKILTEFSGAWQVDGGYAARGQLLAEFKGTFLRAQTEWRASDFVSERLDDDVRWNSSLSGQHNFGLGGFVLPVTVEARHIQRTDGGSEARVGGRTSFSLRSLSLTAGINRQTTRSTFQATPNDQMVAQLLANARLGPVRVRGEAEIDLGKTGGQRYAAVAEYPIDETADLRFDASYNTETADYRATAGLSKQFKSFAASAYAGLSRSGAATAGFNLAFSFGPDPRTGGIRFSRSKLASRGQAVALVFTDENGDGKHQAHEKVEKDVLITAGQALSENPTDRSGRAVVDDLDPWRPVLIGIDANSLSSAYLQPSLPGRVITPRPGVATLVEIPLVSAGEIEGVVVRRNGSSVEGLELELVDARGTVRARTRSEFDGFFLFEGVPYGGYAIRLSKLSAGAAKIERSGLIDAVALTTDKPRLRLGRLFIDADQVPVELPDVIASTAL